MGSLTLFPTAGKTKTNLEENKNSHKEMAQNVSKIGFTSPKTTQFLLAKPTSPETIAMARSPAACPRPPAAPPTGPERRAPRPHKQLSNIYVFLKKKMSNINVFFNFEKKIVPSFDPWVFFPNPLKKDRPAEIW